MFFKKNKKEKKAPSVLGEEKKPPSILGEDEIAEEFIEKEAKEILRKSKNVKGKVFITRETESFTNWRAFQDIGYGLSGSSQPNPPDYDEILRRSGGKKVIDLDLREEPHFFLDGKAVCYEVYPIPSSEWYHSKEKDVLAYEEKLYKKLISPVELFEHVPGTEDEKDNKDPAVPFSLKELESDVCVSKAIQYERVTITDGQRPKDIDTDNLVQIFRKAHLEEFWLHIHCRDGRGRTNTSMVMYEMFYHAKTKNIFEILANHPTVDLLKLQAGDLKGPISMDVYPYFSWKANRTDFLFKFFQYCYDHFDDLHSKEGPKTLFSQYVANQRKNYV